MTSPIKTFPSYDPDTLLDLPVNKSVNITERCSTKTGTEEQVYADFAQAARGVKVIISICYPNKCFGSSREFFISELDCIQSSELSNFRRIAKNCGLFPEELSKIILEVAPPVDRSKMIADLKLLRKESELKNRFFSLLVRAGLTLRDLV